MQKSLCIRTKIMITIFILLLFDAGIILWLESRAEDKFYRMKNVYNQPLEFNSFFNMMLLGDIRDYKLRTSTPIISDKEKRESLVTIIRSLREKIMLVFGITMVVGMLLSICIARGISKPILKLAHVTNNLSNGKLNNNFELPRCAELKVLTESFKRMQDGILEHEEEKTRVDGLEITKNLAAGIAHEIKNPINSVGLIIDYLQTNLSPENPEKRYEFYKLSENMKNELNRINRIVEGFLRLTRPEILDFQEEDINKIIKDSVSVLEPEIVKYNVNLQMNLDSNIPKIKADRDKLKQVFSNLIINALEAMPRGGKMTIVTSIGNEKNISIKIDDNGIGIPGENIKKIFNPYYTTKKQGFGLGLSLTQNIVYKHKGKITVNSVKGKGTSFIVMLPSGFINE